jgi:hypothetical protein
MQKFDFLRRLQEGGWATTVTQHTKITPQTVREVLLLMKNLVDQFNSWLQKNHPNLGSISLGEPTGSGYWYQHDDPNKEYGDIDLQMIAPNPWESTQSSYASQWNQLWESWVEESRPRSVDPVHSTLGHPIIDIGNNQLVQIDFMWHEPHLRAWGLSRSVPPRGIKGLLNGNLFSVLGAMLNMSIQHSGVQIKTQNGLPVSFAKRKDVEIQTISSDPQHFFLHILSWLADKPVDQLNVDPLLQQNPGAKWPNPKIESLVNGIKGLARSLESNGLFGKGILKEFANADLWLTKFWNLYEGKALRDIESAKRLKAETPAALERAARDRQSISSGLAHVREIFDQ